MVVSADHGRFSLPIKGLKRNTRRIVAEGGIGSQIVEAVDAELRAWLEGTSVWMMQQGGDGSIVEGNSVAAPSISLNSGKRCICEVETDHGRVQAINQFAKQPHSLVWQSEDSFTRFLVHAIARYYRIVSFSKFSYKYGVRILPSDMSPLPLMKPSPTPQPRRISSGYFDPTWHLEQAATVLSLQSPSQGSRHLLRQLQSGKRVVQMA